jgi:hypothetical protein
MAPAAAPGKGSLLLPVSPRRSRNRGTTRGRWEAKGTLHKLLSQTKFRSLEGHTSVRGSRVVCCCRTAQAHGNPARPAPTLAHRRAPWTQGSPVKTRPQGDTAIAFTLPECAAHECSHRAAAPGAASQQCTRPSLVPAHRRPEGGWAARHVTALLEASGGGSSGDARGRSSAQGAESQSSSSALFWR